VTRKQRAARDSQVSAAPADGAGVLIVDAGGRILSANSGAGWLLGLDPEELQGQAVEDLVRVRDGMQKGSSAPDGEATAAGTKQAVLHCSGGGETVVHLHTGSIEISGETCTIWTLRSVDPVWEKNHWLRQVVDAMPGVFYVLDEEGRLVYWNRTVEEFYGYTPEELEGKPAIEFIVPEERKRLIEETQRAMAGEIVKGVPHTHVLKDGTTVPHMATGGILAIDGNRYLTGLAVDVSELVAVQEELERKLEEIEELKNRLEVENLYLQSEIELVGDHGNIVGRSRALRKVLAQVEQVAPTDSTVLILGETGTGKELVARRIHELSSRSARPMIKVNCSALPASLVEAELFGREKGAYTGAVSREPGRFELADKSTILLDEIGELPLELQAKLLRVLESGEFERVGSARTLTVDVRVIASTNRNLEEAVRKGTFRSDLYYRLAVFPIEVPPLRERREDVPLLVWHFIDTLAKRMGKSITTVSRSAMERLTVNQWPGNVRELRNVIERSLILTRGETMVLSLGTGGHGDAEEAGLLSMDELQRRHILRALEVAGGRIKGRGGAADMLGMKPSTLRSRMERLGIECSRGEV